MSREILNNLNIHPILGIPVQVETLGNLNENPIRRGLRDRAKKVISPSNRQTIAAVRVFGLNALRLPTDTTLNIDGVSARFEVNTNIEAIRLSKSYERATTKKFLEVLQNRKRNNLETVFANIGSAEGRYTILGAKFADCTYAFEPDPSCFEALCRNIKLNGLQKLVEPYEIALDLKDGIQLFFTDKKDAFSAASFQKTSFQDSEQVVKTRSLESLCKNGMRKPNVVMIDVEGAEERVLSGFGSLRPEHMFLEVHSEVLAKFGTSEAKVLELVRSMGYIAKSATRRSSELQVYYELTCK